MIWSTNAITTVAASLGALANGLGDHNPASFLSEAQKLKKRVIGILFLEHGFGMEFPSAW